MDTRSTGDSGRKHDLRSLQSQLQRNLNRGIQPIIALLNSQSIKPPPSIDPLPTGRVMPLTSPKARYVVVDPLTQGGMGAIYLARDINIQRNVAMKVLLAGEDADRQQVKRFLHEAQITGQLEHPNIVPVHDLGIDGGLTPFYTMKLVQGVSLEEVLVQLREGHEPTIRRFPLSRLLNIFLKACDAVAFAHSKGVIHRDLKPANIMVGDYGEVLVLDWGIAKVRQPGASTPDTDDTSKQPQPHVATSWLEFEPAFELSKDPAFDEAALTQEGEIVGTPHYMAPEQARGQRDIDPRADIYALGGILYTILTTQPPVRATSLPELLFKKNQGEIVPPATYNQAAGRLRKQGLPVLSLAHCPHGHVPPALSAVAMKALATASPDRYPDVPGLQRDIEAYQGGFATSAEEASLVKQLWLLMLRHKGEAAVLSVGLWLVAVVVLVFMILVIQARQDAVHALQKYQQEQRARAAVSAQAAPQFADKSAALIRQGEWDEAKRNLELAINLAPEQADAYHLRVLYHLGRGELTAIREALAAIPPAKPTSLATTMGNVATIAGALDELPRSEPTPAEQLVFLQALAADTDPAVLAFALRDLQHKLIRRPDHYTVLCQATRELILLLNPDLEPRKILYTVHDLRISFTITNTENLRDLSPFSGLPLASLDVAYTGVEDFGPLAGSSIQALSVIKVPATDLQPLAHCRSLVSLDLSYTGVRDLTPLAGVPLRELNLAWTQVKDLTPLDSANLQRLDVSFTRHLRSLDGLPSHSLVELQAEGAAVTSLTPLAAADRLQILNLGKTQVLDLTPLAGLPLRLLDLTRCRRGIDLSPLADCPTLEQLSLPDGAENLQALRQLPNLQAIGFGAHRQPPEAFWEAYGE